MLHLSNPQPGFFFLAGYSIPFFFFSFAPEEICFVCFSIPYFGYAMQPSALRVQGKGERGRGGLQSWEGSPPSPPVTIISVAGWRDV